MIINTLKQCCYLCNYPDIEVDTQEFAFEKTNAYIYCAHDKVCKQYNEREEKQDD